MNDTKLLFAVLIMSAVTVLLRFAPFVIFKNNKTPKTVEYLGKVLPYAVMGMLVVYCLKDVSFFELKNFLPQLIASAVVVISLVIKRNTLVSIVLGTVCYMALVQFVFV